MNLTSSPAVCDWRGGLRWNRPPHWQTGAASSMVPGSYAGRLAGPGLDPSLHFLLEV